MKQKCTVKILDVAWNDLLRIRDWYTLNFSEVSANKVVDAILSALERLESFPNSGSVTPDIWLNDRGFRMVICKKHVAIYKIIKGVVYIYHIADTRMQYTKLFK